MVLKPLILPFLGVFFTFLFITMAINAMDEDDQQRISSLRRERLQPWDSLSLEEKTLEIDRMMAPTDRQRLDDALKTYSLRQVKKDPSFAFYEQNLRTAFLRGKHFNWDELHPAMQAWAIAKVRHQLGETIFTADALAIYYAFNHFFHPWLEGHISKPLFCEIFKGISQKGVEEISRCINKILSENTNLLTYTPDFEDRADIITNNLKHALSTIQTSSL